MINRSGADTTVSNSTFTGNSANGGGAIWNYDSSPQFTDCDFADNTSGTSGGAMYNVTNASPILIGCDFENNTAVSGGAIRNLSHCSPVMASCTFEGNSVTGTSTGGALYNSTYCNPTIINCIFQSNMANSSATGGGMSNADHCSPLIVDCLFLQNGAATRGGGIAITTTCTPEIRRCIFVENGALQGGAIDNNGASNTAAINCQFFANQATHDQGGAIASYDNSQLHLSDCTFSSNSASSAGGAIHTSRCIATCLGCSFLGNTAFSNGGAVRDDGGPSETSEGGPGNTYINCLFTGNSATDDPAMGYGGAVHNDRNDPTFINCILYGNQATVGGGIYNWADIATYPTLSNCVLWNNADDGGTDESAQIFNNDPLVVPAIDFSNIQGWTGSLGGTGNIGSDAILHNPNFIDPDGPDNIIGTEDDNLRFFASSPCIDAGSNLLVPADTFDLDNDGNTTELLPFDLDYTVRFFDYVPATDCPNGGNCGTAPIVDMGAYEFSVTDCNDNGQPDDCDLASGAADDCNNNSIPDTCDIDAGTSEDDNGDSVPDECQVRNLTQGTAHDTIYQAIAAAYDDDELLASPIHFAAEPTIDFDDLAITLRSSDHITQPTGGTTTPADDAKLTTAPAQAMTLSGTVQTTIGDYAELQAGSLNVATTGQIYAPSASIIDVTTNTTTQIHGLLSIDPNATVALSQPATVSGGVQIYGGLLDTPAVNIAGGESILHRYGDLKTDLTNDSQAAFLADTQLIGDMINNGTTTIQSGILTIMGSLSGSGEIVGDFYGKSGNYGLTVTGNFNAPSNATLMLDSGTIKIGGNANIAIDNYNEFDLTTSTLQMVGLPDDGPQTLEALAPDNGRDVTLPNTELFSINRLRIGPTATTVLLADNHDNAPGATTEALYVDELVLEKNTKLDLQGIRIYYNTVDPTDPFDPAGDVTVIDSVGGGDLIPIGPRIKGDWNDNDRVQLDDYPTLPNCLDGPDLYPDPQSPLTPEDCLAVFDFNNDGDVDLADFAAFQTALEVQAQ